MSPIGIDSPLFIGFNPRLALMMAGNGVEHGLLQVLNGQGSGIGRVDVQPAGSWIHSTITLSVPSPCLRESWSACFHVANGLVHGSARRLQRHLNFLRHIRVDQSTHIFA